ncbi:MAG: hypothetical protein GY875_15795 [Gammaproteobacteria bacterium]|nr:hypothetical protein [Gammaproteobacteria bacterium]
MRKLIAKFKFKTEQAAIRIGEQRLAAFDNNSDAVDSTYDSPGGFAGITEFWDLKKPVISAINGMAVGGGFEIALATDLVIAAEHAEFFLPEMQRGFLPDVGAIQILPRKLPYNVAMELLYTGRRMSAQEALQWGLVCRVCAADDLMREARALAGEVAEGAPLEGQVKHAQSCCSRCSQAAINLLKRCQA